jgi:hypothetical protein
VTIRGSIVLDSQIYSLLVLSAIAQLGPSHPAWRHFMITSGFSQQLFSEAELCCPPEGLKWALYTKYSPIVVTVSLYPKCQPNHRRQGCRDKGAKNGCKDLIYAKTGLLCLEVSWRQVSAPHSPFFAFWVADSGSWNGTSLGSPSSRDSTLRLRF